MKLRFILRGCLIEKALCIVETYVSGHRMEVRSHLMVIFAHTLEQDDASGDVDIHHVCFPAGLAYLLAMNLKLPTFVDIAQQPVTEVDAVNDCTLHGDEALQPLIDLHRPRHTVENAGLISGRIEGGVRLEA